MGCGANYKEAEKNRCLLSEARRNATELQGVVERHQHEGYRFKNERDEARSELNESQAASRLLQKRLEEAEAKQENESTRRSRLDTRCSALENESRALRDELLAATAEKMAESKAAEKHRADAGQRDSAFTELRTRASQLAVGFENLESERNSLLAERDHAQEELRLARTEAIAAESEAAVRHAEAVVAQSEAKADPKIASLEQQMQELRNQVLARDKPAARQSPAVEGSSVQDEAVSASKALAAIQEVCTTRTPLSEQAAEAKLDSETLQVPPKRQSRRCPPARRSSTLKANLNGGAPPDDPGATWNALQTGEQKGDASQAGHMVAGSTPMRSPTTPGRASVVSPAVRSPRNVSTQPQDVASARSPVVQRVETQSPRSTSVGPVPQDRPATPIESTKGGESSRRPSRLSQRKSSTVAGARPKAKSTAKQRVAAPWDADEPSSNEELVPPSSSASPARRSVEIAPVAERGKRISLPTPPPQGASSHQSRKVIAPWDEPDSDEGGEEQLPASRQSHSTQAPRRPPPSAPPRQTSGRSASPRIVTAQAQNDTEEPVKDRSPKPTANHGSLSVPPSANRGNARESSRDSGARGSVGPQVARRIRPSPRPSVRSSEAVAVEAAHRPPPRENPSAQVFSFDFSVFDFLQHEALQSARGIRGDVPGSTSAMGNYHLAATSGYCGPSSSSASTVASSSSPLLAIPPVPSSARSQQSPAATQGSDILKARQTGSQRTRSPRKEAAESSESSVVDSVSEIWDSSRGRQLHARGWEDNDTAIANRARSGSKRCP